MKPINMGDNYPEFYLLDFWKKEGYTHIKFENGQFIALRRFMFTTGLVIGLEENFYYGRYCYQNHSDAVKAIETFNGTGDPSGEWIKYKGVGGERSNVLNNNE